MSKESLVNALARCLLAGDQTADAVVHRCNQLLGHAWRWITPLAINYLAGMAGITRPRQDEVVGFLLRDPVFERAWDRHHKRLLAIHWLTEPQQMQPVAAAKEWHIPRIESARALADWFWLEDSQLDWFADLSGLGYAAQNPRLCHYRYRILEKPGGGLRLIESPKRRLKEMQRQILEYILDPIPVHPAVHGFVKGRSIKTFAAPHAGRPMVLRMDLQNFFPSFSCARIRAFFRTIGFPETVSNLLGGICTTATPPSVWRTLTDETYSRPHLPQGSPTSPALANLCSFRMDCRLSGLAKSAGAEYTRYADDLAFSGDAEFARRGERFALHAAALLEEEGFLVRHRKTRLMRQGVRQHLAGLVVNQHLNVPRRDFDELKAILTNCLQSGPESQNRERHPAFRAHLEGRVGFVELVNPGRGAKLRKIFARIDWPLL